MIFKLHYFGDYQTLIKKLQINDVPRFSEKTQEVGNY